MGRTFEHEIDEVRDDLLRMGGVVEEMIVGANASLMERDDDRAKAVRVMDNEVDLLEKQVDERTADVLVRHQPMATDLRFLVVALKITNDLERMGDCAVNIAKAVKIVNQEPPLKPYIDLPHMASMTAAMVRDALNAFVHQNVDLAREVMERDQDVDALYKQLFRELLTFMIEAPQNVTRSLHLLLIARNYERIADHAQNISEEVIFYVEGEDVRHAKAEAKAEKASEASS